jgi:hypothetical protein
MQRTVTEIVSCLILLSVLGCAPHESGSVPSNEQMPARSTTPAFKGIEIYSWQDTETGIWYIVWMHGTNRNKLSGEVLGWRTTRELRDIQQVKEMIYPFAPKTTIAWGYRPVGETPENIQWGAPEWIMAEDAQADLIDYAESLEITLFLPQSPR